MASGAEVGLHGPPGPKGDPGSTGPAGVSVGVNVMDYGAMGDNSHDDTAAIQAAIDSYGANGGPIYLPPGIYKITSGLVGKRWTSIIGAGAGWGNPHPTTLTVINANSITANNSVALDMGALGTADGQRFENFKLYGDLTAVNVTTGIFVGGTQQTLRNVVVVGFRVGINAVCTHSVIDHVWTDIPYTAGLDLNGGSSNLITGCNFANVGNGANDGANLRIRSSGYGDGADNTIINTLTDEGFNGATTVLIYNGAARNTIIGGRILLSGPVGTGYGVRLGNVGNDAANSTQTTLMNVTIGNGTSEQTTATLIIRGTGHNFINVKTLPNGSPNDVLDYTTDSTYLNLNGAYRLPSMPTASPGVGSKQLWADPADSYTVKFAN